MTPPELFVTNFNKRFTGVSATAAAVLRSHQFSMNCTLVGHPLPGLPAPISWTKALRLSRVPPPGRPFAIWHVRRNSEMQLALIARDVLRLPVKIVFTSAAQRLHSAWPRWLISKMDAVIATTEDAACFVPNVQAVVPHGVDTQQFSPAGSEEDAQAAWQETGFGGSYGIVTIGRIRPEKGTDLFVHAMIEALPQLPGAQAVVIGAAKSEHAGFLDELKAEIAAAGLSSRFSFPGEIGADQLPEVLRGARLLMALPRYEGYGVTPLEAMACAVPVVLSDTGNFAEFTGHLDPSAPPLDDTAGRLVPLEDTRNAANWACEILSTPSLHHQLAQTARARAVSHFSVAAEAREIAQVYEQLWSETKA